MKEAKATPEIMVVNDMIFLPPNFDVRDPKYGCPNIAVTKLMVTIATASVLLGLGQSFYHPIENSYSQRST